MDCFDDLQMLDESLRGGVKDAGLLFDIRLLTRESAPPFSAAASFSSASGFRSPSTLLDCDYLLQKAAEAKRNGRMEEYEKRMRALVRFFGNYGPARSPQQVRRAFRLSASASAFSGPAFASSSAFSSASAFSSSSASFGTSRFEEQENEISEQRVKTQMPFLDEKKVGPIIYGSFDATQVDCVKEARRNSVN